MAGIADIQPAERFTLGVNYWPRRKAMRFWADFDRAEVREEFSVIAELGLHVVRIFLLWDDWQPAPDRVSTARLNDLVAVADIADELGLGLDVTFFTGHMSGPNWAPGWLVGGDDRPGGRLVVTSHRYIDGGYRNPYIDATALAAQRLQLGEVVRVMADHPAIWMWNLGNEPDLFGRPPDHRAGRTWVSEMVELVRRHDDRHPVTCGLHAESLIADVGFRPGEVFGEVDVAVMHAYPQYVDWGREPLDPAVVPFACALTSTLAGRPVLMEEFGGCTAEPGASSFWWEWDLDGRRAASVPRRRGGVGSVCRDGTQQPRSHRRHRRDAVVLRRLRPGLVGSAAVRHRPPRALLRAPPPRRDAETPRRSCPPIRRDFANGRGGAAMGGVHR